MKKIFSKIFVAIFISFVALSSAFCLTACDTASFDSTPWGSLTTESAQIAEKLQDISSNLKHMLGSGRDDLSIRAQFETTTTFTFYKDPQNESLTYPKKTIKEVTYSTFTSSSNIEIDPMANVTTQRLTNGVSTSKTEEIYATNDGCVYIKDETNSSNGTLKVQERIEDIEPSGDYFLSILKQKAILLCNNTKEISKLEQKSFDGVKYYKLSSDNSSSKEQINKKFTLNTEVNSYPHLFEVYDLGYDYVDSFYYIYGINDDANAYVSYFEMHYTISRAVSDYDGERETYLDVALVTKLVAKGSEINSPQRPENINAYVVGNFVYAMQNYDNYVVYQKGSKTGLNQKITLYTSLLDLQQKKQIKVESYNAETLVQTDYYVVANGRTYKITPSGDDIIQTESDYTESYLNFDFDSVKNSSSQDTFHYGSSGSGFSIKITNGTLSISPIVVVGDDITYTILSYSSGAPQTYLYDVEA